MPNYRRDKTRGGTWFFTVIAFKRRPIFCDEIFRDSLKRSIQRVRKNYPFKIDAWVLLPNHIHCVWTLPEDDTNFSLRWKLIKQFVTRDCKNHFQMKPCLTDSKRKRRESTIWQRRFWEHRIRSEKDFKHHMDYIHYNPVKHGLSQSPGKWPYSTIHQLIKRGVYPDNWAITNQPKLNQVIKYGE